MLKEKEIKIIEDLCKKENDTYFGEVFSEDDGFIMTQNIKNDFPILLGTRMGEEMASLKEAVRSLKLEIVDLKADAESERYDKESAEEDLTSNYHKILDLAKDAILNQDTFILDYFIKFSLLSEREVIRLKIENDVALSSAEKSLVIEKLGGAK